MGSVIVNESSLEATAAAIRQRAGTTDTYKPSEFAAAIADIPGGPDLSADTVAADKVLAGYTFHDSTGTADVGTIPEKTAADLSASGPTVTVPAGHYASQAQKSVNPGSAATPATAITANPTISVDAAGRITATVSEAENITPAVTPGYVSAGTPGTVSVSGSAAQQLPAKAAATYDVSATDRTISAGQYLTGNQTIRGVTVENLSAENIKAGVTVKVGDADSAGRIRSVTGTVRAGMPTTLTVSVASGASVSATNGTDTVTGTSVGGACVLSLPSGGTWTVTATKDGSSATPVTVTVQDNYPVALTIPQIYGVEWDWTSGSSTRGVRTDDAAGFGDPSPAVSNGTGSSPFDNLYPWNQMTTEERTGGTMVKEPKYWFKWTITDEGQRVKLQIANYAAEGFHVDPVNMDRGDGLGELDYSYIARYHCATSTYKSETNKAQACKITRSSARTSIHNLGSYIWQMDFAQMWYVGMLYLVEFADWNGQNTIGYGGSASSSKANNGQTDAMQYHTGTTAANRTTYGYTQYRNIEGWWDNVFDWTDGCYYNSSGLNVILNPANFSDSANGTLIGSMPTISGCPTALQVPTTSGFEWAVCPLVIGGHESAYVPDYWEIGDSSYPCLLHGGSTNRGVDQGLFCFYSSLASFTAGNIGCRLQERPPKAA